MIPEGAKNLTLNYSENYSEVLRKQVGVEVKDKYGKILVPPEYIGEKLVVLIPKEVYDKVNKSKRSNRK